MNKVTGNLEPSGTSVTCRSAPRVPRLCVITFEGLSVAAALFDALFYALLGAFYYAVGESLAFALISAAFIISCALLLAGHYWQWASLYIPYLVFSLLRVTLDVFITLPQYYEWLLKKRLWYSARMPFMSKEMVEFIKPNFTLYGLVVIVYTLKVLVFFYVALEAYRSVKRKSNTLAPTTPIVIAVEHNSTG